MSCELNSNCCTCLSATSSYQIFELVEENYKILEMLDSLVPQINIKDKLQICSHVCKDCVKKLLIGYKFQQMCIETNKKLQDLLHRTASRNDKTLENALDPLMTEADIEVKFEVGESDFMKCKVSSDKLGNQLAEIEPSCSDPASQTFVDESNYGGKGEELQQADSKGLKPFQRFKCRCCSKTFTKQTSLAAHCKVHCKKDVAKIKRKKAGSAIDYATPSFLQENGHTIEDKEPRSIDYKETVEKDSTGVGAECPTCRKVFKSDYKLKLHKRIHKSFLCPHCGKTFRGLSNLNEHTKRHLGLQTFQCPECPKRFNCKSDMSKHASSHSNAKPFACDICGSRFTRKFSMLHHKALHTAERTYKCDQCSMSFKLLFILKRHMSTHTGEKPHKCNYCDRAYLASGDLTKHLRTHVGQNTYMCEQCPMSFKYQAELRKHQSHHYKLEQNVPEISMEMQHHKKKENNKNSVL